MDIADKIRYIRQNILCLSVSDFADLCGVSRRSVHSWESGLSIPCLDNIITISLESLVTIDYLLIDGKTLEFSLCDISDESFKLLTQIVLNYRKINEKK